MCWGGRGNPVQYSCLENAHGQRSPAGCSPRGRSQRVGHDREPKHSAARVSVNSEFPVYPFTPPPLVRISLFSVGLCLFLICKHIHLYQFVDVTSKESSIVWYLPFSVWLPSRGKIISRSVHVAAAMAWFYSIFAAEWYWLASRIFVFFKRCWPKLESAGYRVGFVKTLNYFLLISITV